LAFIGYDSSILARISGFILCEIGIGIGIEFIYLEPEHEVLRESPNNG
jgi:hypothetical protein